MEGGGGNLRRPLLDVSGIMTSTSGQSKSTTKTSMKNGSQKTSVQSKLVKSQITIFSVQDFLAKAFRLLGKGRDSRTLVGRYFSRYAESFRLKDPRWFFWRMSRVFSPTTVTEPSASSSNPYGNLGMWDNTKCLTARISESPRTGSVSLSSVLEEKVAQKYFLSEKQQRWIQKWKDKQR